MLNQHLWKMIYSTSVLWNLSSRLLSSGSLVIISPSVDDTATYECTVTNDAGEDKRTVDLTVQGTGLLYGLTVAIRIHFIIPLVHKRASFSTHLTFTYSVGTERCMIRIWKFGGAENMYFLFVVIVLVPPSIADEPTDFLVTKHAPMVITCTASGVPLPSIHWTKNGIRLLPRGDGYRILSSGKTKLSDYTSMIRLIMNGWLHQAFSCTKIKE